MNDILAILSGGDYVSGEKISQELGISRAAVWKRIAQLREEGKCFQKKKFRIL